VSLVAQNLVFSYPDRIVLEDVSFEINAGQTVALVGENGAGKTTLLRCLAGLEQPRAGKVIIGGKDLSSQVRAAKRHLGYVRDLFGLHDQMTVDEFLEYIAQSRQAIYKDERDFVVNSLQIADLLPRSIHTLTRGMRQKVAIAQAIIHNPDVLLLDEPASGLDPEARDRLAVLMNSLRERGKAILVSSHILSELEAYATHLLLLKNNRVEQLADIKTQTEVALPLWQLEIIFLNEGAHSQILFDLTGIHFACFGKILNTTVQANEKDLHTLLKAVSAHTEILAFSPQKFSFEAWYKNAVHGKKPDFPVLRVKG
jgi:ABC-2 type transport system ATP-binding protein